MELLTIQNINKIEDNKFGVYKIYLYENGNPIVIRRFLKDDSSGLIYIGSAQKTSIRYRLTCFLKSTDPLYRQNNHSGGDKIKNNSNLREFVNKKQIMFELETFNNPRDLERNLLIAYRQSYGELPALNG